MDALVQVGVQAMADRYTYMPLVGVFIMLAWGAPDLLPRLGARAATAAWAGTAAVAVCVAGTAWQVGHWKDTRALWEHALAVTANNSRAEVFLGEELARQGRLDAAVTHYQQALKIERWRGILGLERS